MVRVKKNSSKGRSPKNSEFKGHPWSKETLTGLAATNPAELEWEVLEQAPPVITNLCLKACKLYGQGIRMGLLFTQGAVRIHKNGVLMVNTPGYVGALWSYEGDGA